MAEGPEIAATPNGTFAKHSSLIGPKASSSSPGKQAGEQGYIAMFPPPQTLQILHDMEDSQGVYRRQIEPELSARPRGGGCVLMAAVRFLQKQ